MLNPLINRPHEDEETVLLMATNPTFLSDYRPFISAHCTCLTAATYTEAIQLLQKVPIKALLLADQVPDESSMEFIRTAHRIKPDIQKVLLAEQADAKILITAFNEGCLFRCLLAPIPPVALVRAVKDTLRRYEMERVQRELADHAMEIDLYLHSIPYWLHRFKTTVSLCTRSILMGVGLILGSGLLILLLGVSILLLLYFLKCLLGIDFFADRHLRDFLPVVSG